MIDLHSHILPGLDDGAANLSVSIAMARAYEAQGVTAVACTPHILPGCFNNSGDQIRVAVADLQQRLGDLGIELKLYSGADNYVVANFVSALHKGILLSLADSRYVLVEPPHSVAPARLDNLLFEILAMEYVPILTHPERLKWIESKYEVVCRLAECGVWMQITSGSLLGKFGRTARYWAERMLSEGRVQLLATDAHDDRRRPPDLLEGRQAAEKLVGTTEAEHLARTRPADILANKCVADCVARETADFQYRFWGYSPDAKPFLQRDYNPVPQRLRRFFF